MPGSTRCLELRAARPEQLRLLDRLPEFRRSGKLCDVKLRSRDGTLYEAHRLVLSLASDALSGLMGGIFCEGQDGREVEADLPGKLLEGLLDFVYSGAARVPLAGARELLRFAHMFALDDLVRHLVDAVE